MISAPICKKSLKAAVGLADATKKKKERGEEKRKTILALMFTYRRGNTPIRHVRHDIPRIRPPRTGTADTKLGIHKLDKPQARQLSQMVLAGPQQPQVCGPRWPAQHKT
jgi:hypothetical protein